VIVSVVIPSFRAKQTIIDVITTIPESINAIYIVDDACPDGTGQHVLDTNTDRRVIVIKNDINQGVGGATLAGLR
jgi:glycosyltransferase involved in cell wall biosynthesis